jgi:lysophospholipid acyltransferase (LPLAT)-like uncharacterized protein
MKLPGVEYKSPYRFTFKQRLILFIFPPVLAFLLKLLFRFAKLEVRNLDSFEVMLKNYNHGILAFWHESMGLAACYTKNRNYHTLTSYSYDGEMAARVVSWFGSEAVRGSSSKGGSVSLRELEKVIRLVECVGITMDGPRGPRRIAKPGAAILSARTQTPIIPMAFAVSPNWRLNSWDRFPVPKLGAKIILQFGDVLLPPEQDTPEAVEALRVHAESALNEIHNTIEEEIGDEQTN